MSSDENDYKTLKDLIHECVSSSDGVPKQGAVYAIRPKELLPIHKAVYRVAKGTGMTAVMMACYAAMQLLYVWTGGRRLDALRIINSVLDSVFQQMKENDGHDRKQQSGLDGLPG